MEPILPRIPRRSLRVKILLPLILVGCGVAAVMVWLLQERAHSQLATALSHRAELVANMTNYAAESISRTGELQRIVTAIGADRDILTIVVIAGEPPETIASTRRAWLGQKLDSFPDRKVAENLLQALRERAQRHHFDDEAHSFTYFLPLQLTHGDLTKEKSSDGLVMVQLDTRPLSQELRQSTLTLSLFLLFGLFVFSAIAYVLLNKVLLRPLSAISRHLENTDSDPTSLTNEMNSDDEVGRLAIALQDYRNRNTTALHELANQKYALDQHAIVAITDIKGNITYANDRLCAISGYSREELLGQNHRILKSGLHDEDFFRQMWRTVANGQVWHGEICNRSKQGSIYWVSSTIVPLLGLHGKPEAYIAIRTDITERKQIEAQLKTAEESAVAASKAKSDFLATMSHEIRTPLNGIIGFTEVLLEADLASEHRRHVEMLRTSGENLLVLINDILDFSKIEAGRFVLENAPVNFLHCVEDVVALLKQQASKKSLNLTSQFASDVPVWVQGDAVRIRQLLFNLIGNAIKFTANGSVRVAVDLRGSNLHVSVVDTGIGMNADQRARIFQKFSQADTSTTRRFGGTGLGLVICKSLVEAMGGEIGVESTPGLGSTFWFKLPCKITESPLAESSPATGTKVSMPTPIRDSPSTTAPVLVVDDSEVNTLVASSMLATFNLKTDTAANGRIAIEKAAQQRYSLILMDYHMPVLDGCQATQAIRASNGLNQTTVIIGFSASLDDRDTCLAAGMNDFLPKPFRKAELQQLLAKVLPS